jgi:hypothetical protein
MVSALFAAASRRGFAWLPAALFMLMPAAALAQIQVFDDFNFLDNRQANSIAPAETLISFGADLSPTLGTTVTATQGTKSYNVPYLNSPALPYQFFTSIPYSPTLTGPWKLTIANPSYATVTVNTSALYAGTPTPFITNPSTDGFTTTPTISWVQPTYSAPPGTTAGTSFLVIDLNP